MNTKEKKRIEALEADLLPRKLLTQNLHSIELSETSNQYLQHLFTESLGSRLAALTPDFKFPARRLRESGQSVEPRLDPKPFFSEWFFTTKLIVSLNASADDLVLRAKERLDLAETILQFRGKLRISNSVRWTELLDLGKFTTVLIKARDCLVSNMLELASLRLAGEIISEKYGEGHELLLKNLALEMEELYSRTLECAHEYELTLEEMMSAPAPSGTQWPPDLCSIDFDALQKSAVSEGNEMVRMLKAYAKAQMHIAFDQGPDALKELKPFMPKDDTDTEEE
jgi:hypothetical protein